MQKKKWGMSAVWLSLLLLCFSEFSEQLRAATVYTDITAPAQGTRIPVPGMVLDPRPGINQSSTLPPGVVLGQDWTMARFILGSDNTITYEGGFSPRGNAGYKLGDIFIDTVGGFDQPNGAGQTLAYPNPGFEYVIHMEGVVGNSMNYTLYKLLAGASVLPVQIQQNEVRNPLEVVVDGNLQALFSGSALILDNVPASTISATYWVSNLGNDGNSLVSFFVTQPVLSGEYLHLYETIGCGNASMEGAQVPEAPTWGGGGILIAIAGCCLARRRAWHSRHSRGKEFH